MGELEGESIVQGDITHIYKLLEFLYEYSKIFLESRKPHQNVKSARGKGEDLLQDPKINSARNPERQFHHTQPHEIIQQQEQKTNIA